MKESGLSMVVGSKEFFLVTERTNITKKVVQLFIEEIMSSRNASKEDIEKAKNDERTLNLKNAIFKATLEDKGTHYIIKAKNSVQSIPKAEVEKCLVVFFEWEE